MYRLFRACIAKLCVESLVDTRISSVNIPKQSFREVSVVASLPNFSYAAIRRPVKSLRETVFKLESVCLTGLCTPWLQNVL